MSIRRYNRDDLPQLALRNREHRAGLAINVVAFFAAVGVVGWYGVSGLDLSADEGPTANQQIDAMFAEMQAQAEAAAAAYNDATMAATQMWAEDEPEFDGRGSFGDPMTDLFQDRSDTGGWGDAANNSLT